MNKNNINAIKKILFTIILLFGLSMSTMVITSCSCSPEALGRKDAKELNQAVRENSSKKMNRATKHSERHLDKYQNDRDKYFRYVDAYKNALE